MIWEKVRNFSYKSYEHERTWAVSEGLVAFPLYKSLHGLFVCLLQGYIKGYISHQHQKLVVSKQNPFPSLTSFL